MDDLSRLFTAYDRNGISRRRLFHILGAAAVSTPLTRAFGQGQCSGRDRDTTAACNKTPFKAPFESTGFRTVLLDHFKLQVVASITGTNEVTSGAVRHHCFPP